MPAGGYISVFSKKTSDNWKYYTCSSTHVIHVLDIYLYYICETYVLQIFNTCTKHAWITCIIHLKTPHIVHVYHTYNPHVTHFLVYHTYLQLVYTFCHLQRKDYEKIFWESNFNRNGMLYKQPVQNVKNLLTRLISSGMHSHNFGSI